MSGTTIFVMLAILSVLAALLYLTRDKTDWDYGPEDQPIGRRVDKSDPTRVQVWDDSEASGTQSGVWIDEVPK